MPRTIGRPALRPTAPKPKPTWNELPPGDDTIPDFRALVPQGTQGALPAKLVEARRIQILKLYVNGQTPEQIALKLHLGRKTVEHDIAFVLDAVTRTFAQASPQHTFVRYALFQLGVITRLQTTYEKLLSTDPAKTGNAVIAALRAQSDIYDKVYEKGAEYGVIKRQQASTAIHKAPHDLRIELRREIRTMATLLDKVDTFTNFKSLRKPYTRHPRTYARIRRVQKDAYGFIFQTRDWKYKHTVTREELIATVTAHDQHLQDTAPYAPPQPLPPPIRVQAVSVGPVPTPTTQRSTLTPPVHGFLVAPRRF